MYNICQNSYQASAPYPSGQWFNIQYIVVTSWIFFVFFYQPTSFIFAKGIGWFPTLLYNFNLPNSYHRTFQPNKGTVDLSQRLGTARFIQNSAPLNCNFQAIKLFESSCSDNFQNISGDRKNFPNEQICSKRNWWIAVDEKYCYYLSVVDMTCCRIQEAYNRLQVCFFISVRTCSFQNSNMVPYI